MEEYYSHYREQDDKFQANREHQKNVAVLSRQYCQVEVLKKTAYLIGLHHDDGKTEELWQQYFLSKIRGKDTSSFLGNPAKRNRVATIFIVSLFFVKKKKGYL